MSSPPAPPPDCAGLHCFVEGRVQGVFFRACTRERARALGLQGWVRNLPDGRVEVLARGAPGALRELRSWLAHGPSGARVEQLRCRAAASGQVYDDCGDDFRDDFRIR